MFTDTRLVVDSGSSTNQGRVEVLTPFGWLAMCSDGWTIQASITMCRQLGYPFTSTPGLNSNSEMFTFHAVLLNVTIGFFPHFNLQLPTVVSQRKTLLKVKLDGY